MLLTKIVTCLLGIALMIPVAASFWVMVRYKPQPEAELQKSLDEALAPVKNEIDSQVTPGFPGAMATRVEIHHQITLPFFSHRFWLVTPRRWVGFVGLSCCLIIAVLWVYSSFASVVAISGDYGRSGMDELPVDEAAPDSPK